MMIVLYCVIVIILRCIAILFSSYPAYLAYKLSIIIPIISIVILIINRLCIKVRINVNEKVVSKGDNISVSIQTKNIGIFPSGEILAYMELYYGEYSQAKKKICFSSMPFKNTVTFQVATEYAGNMRLICKKVELCDYFRMFKFKIQKGKKEYDIQVLPKPLPIQITYNQCESHEIIEADSYHLLKKGYDRTELFNVREYVPGDNLRDIHWKLTDRMGKYMVKEYSLPISVGLGIITDFTEYAINFDSVIVADKIVEIAYSICNNVLLEGGKYNIYYFNKNNGIMDQQLIDSEEKLTESINIILDTVLLKRNEKIEDESIVFDRCNQYNIIYITSKISELLAQRIKLNANKKIAVVLVALNENAAKDQIAQLDSGVQYYVVNAKAQGIGNINEIRF